jgi:uncharacterized protein
MKRRTSFGILALLLAVSWFHPVKAAESNTPAATRHSLWKVEDQNRTLYLLGSIHALKPEHYPLARPIETAFSNSQIVVFEADIEQMNSMNTQLKLLEKSQLPEGETLKDHLSPDLYASFSKHVKEAGMSMMMFMRLKPAMAALMLEVYEMLEFGLKPEYGLDKYFFGRAQETGKQTEALETVDFQISLVTDISKEEGELLVKTTLAEIDNTKKLYAEMLTAWETGNAPGLEKLLNESMHEAPMLFKRLVTDRNQRWIPKLEEWLRGGKTTIAIVGAGHLVGGEGVVELLRKKGFKVTQM